MWYFGEVYSSICELSKQVSVLSRIQGILLGDDDITNTFVDVALIFMSWFRRMCNLNCWNKMAPYVYEL